MIYHDVIDPPLFAHPTIVTADGRQQFVAIARNPVHAKRHGEGDIQILQTAHVRHEIHRHDLGREGSIRSHDFEGRSGRGDCLSGLQRGVIAGVIE